MNNFKEQIQKEISTTLAIDFDGVIHKNSKGYHDGTIYDDPIDGTKSALKDLSEKYALIIYTCKGNPERSLINGKTGTELIWEWLEKHDLKQYISDVTYTKPRALFYIDDKAITFDSWGNVWSKIRRYELVNKDKDIDITKF